MDMRLRKRNVVLSKNNEFKGEFTEVPNDFEFSEGDKVITHFSETNLGYRADKIIDEIKVYQQGKDSFSSSLATVLYLHIMWDKVKASFDENGAYVIIGDKRYYSNFEVTKDNGKPLPDLKTSMRRVTLKVKVADITFTINVLTLMYILFYNTSGYNPTKENKLATLLKTEDGLKPENIGLMDGASWTNDVRAMLNAIRDQNLLVPGYTTYYTLISSEELGVGLNLEKFRKCWGKKIPAVG
ncbi:hypothetical protein D3C71_1487630 [compost metagenome]